MRLDQIMQRRSFGLPLAALILGSFTLSSGAAHADTSTSLIPVTVSLAANNAIVGQGTAVIFTATVTPTTTPPTTGEQYPTGTVVFYDGTTAIGTSKLSALSIDDASTATLTLTTLPAGTDSITAAYAGDTVFAAGVSTAISIDVQSFALSPAATNPATNLDIVQGGTGTESFVVSSLGGYTGKVQVLCSTNAQDDISCTPSPQQVTPPATVTFTVQTYVTGGPLHTSARSTPASFWPKAAGGIALAIFLCFTVPFGRRARIFHPHAPRHFLLLLLFFAGLAGTGIGCSSSRVVTANGTPLGVATLKVTAIAYIDNTATSQTLYFTVNVTKP